MVRLTTCEALSDRPARGLGAKSKRLNEGKELDYDNYRDEEIRERLGEFLLLSKVKSLSQQQALLRPAAKPYSCAVGQKRSQRGVNHACEPFRPAALASNFSLGLMTTLLFG